MTCPVPEALVPQLKGGLGEHPPPQREEAGARAAEGRWRERSQRPAGLPGVSWRPGRRQRSLQDHCSRRTATPEQAAGGSCEVSGREPRSASLHGGGRGQRPAGRGLHGEQGLAEAPDRGSGRAPAEGSTPREGAQLGSHRTAAHGHQQSRGRAGDTQGPLVLPWPP